MLFLAGFGLVLLFRVYFVLFVPAYLSSILVCLTQIYLDNLTGGFGDIFLDLCPDSKLNYKFALTKKEFLSQSISHINKLRLLY